MRNEKLHAIVARSKCPSQNVQSAPCSDPLWKFGCRKTAHCGAKNISKSKCTKRTMFFTIFGSSDAEKLHFVEAHFQVKMFKKGLGPFLEDQID